MQPVKIWHVCALLSVVKAQLGFSEIHLGSATIIKSPDYPRNIGPQVQMEWSISADMGFRIKVTFQVFNLPANNDCKQLFLNIAEGDSTVMNKADNRICGSHPKTFITKTGKVSIFLRSDSDPERGALKNFVLRLEKTRERSTDFKPGQWAGKAKTSYPAYPIEKPRTPVTRSYAIPSKIGGPHNGGYKRLPTMTPQTRHRLQNENVYGSPNNVNPYSAIRNPAYQPVPRAPVPQAPNSFPRAPQPNYNTNLYSVNSGSVNHVPAQNMQGSYDSGMTGEALSNSESSKLEVENKDSSVISYALPLGLLAMVILSVSALFLVKRFLITGHDDEKEHRVHH